MDPLEEVCAHVNDVVGRGLTADKILDRGTVLEVTDDAIVFEVERHQAASGAFYREGFAMNAFITYWPRYRYDRASHELTQLEERRSRKFDCNYDLLADELLEHMFELQLEAQDDAWRCRERVMNSETRVETEADLQAFAEQLIRDWDPEGVFGWELEDILDEEAFEAHFSKLEERLVTEARRKARRAWDRRDERL